jgi:hypothetical protein
VQLRCYWPARRSLLPSITAAEVAVAAGPVVVAWPSMAAVVAVAAVLVEWAWAAEVRVGLWAEVDSRVVLVADRHVDLPARPAVQALVVRSNVPVLLAVAQADAPVLPGAGHVGRCSAASSRQVRGTSGRRHAFRPDVGPLSGDIGTRGCSHRS